MLPGFNDRGAHIINMVYFDGNLRALKIGLEDGEQSFSRMLRRLTQEPAEFFGFEDVGSLDIGQRADIALLDLQVLSSYDGEASIKLIHRELFGCEQLVNRSDGVVSDVFAGGTKVWSDNSFTDQHGQMKLGQALKVSN